jgi:predicted DNA-binding transcriptional regulator YafY
MLYQKLLRGEFVNKTIFSLDNNINERSFDRDIEDIRLFLSASFSNNEVLYNKENNGYYLTGMRKERFHEEDAFVMLLFLLNSHAFRKDELDGLITNLMSSFSSESKSKIFDSLGIEKEIYWSVSHNKAILKTIWDLTIPIRQEKKIEITYTKANLDKVDRVVYPVSVTFSDYYFYLIAYREDEQFTYPAFFRIDRIQNFKIRNERYRHEIKVNFRDLKAKKYLHFMSAGELVNVTLKCNIACVEVVLDKLADARIVENVSEYKIIKAKVFEEGFIRWIVSQSEEIEVISPSKLRKRLLELFRNLYEKYSE